MDKLTRLISLLSAALVAVCSGTLFAFSQVPAEAAAACDVHKFDESSIAVPAQAAEAARNGLQRFLNAIPENQLRKFNFSNLDQLKHATVGQPLRLFVLEPNNITHCPPDVALQDVIEPFPQWFFPVVSDGEYRTILTVESVKGTWMAAEIGNSDLATSFAALNTTWPHSAGYGYIFVRNYQTLSEFIILTGNGSTNVDPLPSAVTAWGMGAARLLKPSEALAFLRHSLEQELSAQKSLR